MSHLFIEAKNQYRLHFFMAASFNQMGFILIFLQIQSHIFSFLKVLGLLVELLTKFCVFEQSLAAQHEFVAADLSLGQSSIFLLLSAFPLTDCQACEL